VLVFSMLNAGLLDSSGELSWAIRSEMVTLERTVLPLIPLRRAHA
jgi:hypothetical protein